MEYRILDLGYQYKIASLYGMRYAIHFDRYITPVAEFEARLIQHLGQPASTLTVRRSHRYQSYRWYSGWKNLRASRVEWLMAFHTEKDRTIALLHI